MTATTMAPAQPIVTNTVPNDSNNNNCTRTSEAMRNWIDAPEFVPRYITQNTSCDENTNQASCDDIQGASRLVTYIWPIYLPKFIELLLFAYFFHFLLWNSSQQISYAQIVSGNVYDVGDASDAQSNLPTLPPPPPSTYAEATICPYIQTTITKSDGTISCKYGDRCPYQHGELCDICGSYCLHPTDKNQRKTHQKVCYQV